MSIKRDDLVLKTKKQYNDDITDAFILGLDEGKDKAIDFFLRSGQMRLRDLSGIELNQGQDQDFDMDSYRKTTKEALKRLMK
jgi:hypothetical protein